MVPTPLTIRIMVTMDEPHADARLGERADLFFKGALRLDVTQKDHGRRRIASRSDGRQHMVDAPVHITQEIDHVVALFVVLPKLPFKFRSSRLIITLPWFKPLLDLLMAEYQQAGGGLTRISATVNEEVRGV